MVHHFWEDHGGPNSCSLCCLRTIFLAALSQSVWESSNVPRSIPIYQMCHCFWVVKLVYRNKQFAPERWPTPQKESSSSNIPFQVRTVGFRAGIYVCQQAWNMDIASFFCKLKQGSVQHILLGRIVNRRRFDPLRLEKKGQRQTCVFFQHFKRMMAHTFQVCFGQQEFSAVRIHLVGWSVYHQHEDHHWSPRLLSPFGRLMPL